MIRRAVSRLTYANVAATLALFVALGGSAYAGLAVTGSNVVNGSLSGADVHDGSLTGADVRNESLTGADIKNLTAADFRAKRKFAILIMVTVAAILTPGPDVFSQCMLAVPMIILYELGILLVRNGKTAHTHAGVAG